MRINLHVTTQTHILTTVSPQIGKVENNKDIIHDLNSLNSRTGKMIIPSFQQVDSTNKKF